MSITLDGLKIDEVSKKCEEFWKVINSCRIGTLDQKQQAFKELGISPSRKVLLYRENCMSLYHCPTPDTVESRSTLLIIPSLINRNYIMDLIHNHSLLEALTFSGVDCYLIDWGTPGEEHREVTLDTYIGTYLRRAFSRVSLAAGRKVHILGQCIGGLLASTFAALLGNDERLASLTLITTPVDLSKGGLLTAWTDVSHFNLDKTVNSFLVQGTVPPEVLHMGFPFLDIRMMFQKYENLFNFASSDEFVHLYRALDFWANDNVPFPCEVLRQFIRDFYQENRFFRGDLFLCGKRLSPSMISVPIHNIAARFDHVMPVDSAMGWRKERKGDVQTVYDGGHVTIIAGLPLRFKVYADIISFIHQN